MTRCKHCNAAIDPTYNAEANQAEITAWLQIRADEAKRIDPETAEFTWWYAQTADPYGVYDDTPAQESVVGREYFVRNKGSDIWVLLAHVPLSVQDAIWKRVSTMTPEELDPWPFDE
jgi:hypothetical protein